jgi:tripartite-type tricarboxylate transporter receptor subunit TctC
MKSITRCTLFVSTLSLSLICQAQTPAKPDTYPSRPLRMIVPYTTGAGADLTARTIGHKLSESFAQPVVVENRPGANGILGTEAALKTSPDGYTLLLIDRGALGVNPSLYKKLPYDPLSSFEYVGIAVWGPYVLVVNPRLQASNVNELVTLAKAKPGTLNYGSWGAGSLPQIGFEALKLKAGIDMTHVPYKGAALAVTAAVTGEVAVTASSAAGIIGQIRAGKLRPIAIGSPRRSPLLPDVPTLAEAGVSEESLPPTFFAFAVPAGTPRPIVNRLSGEIRRIVHSKDVAERLVNAGLEPFGSSSEEMTEIVRRDLPWFAKAVKAIGIQPE